MGANGVFCTKGVDCTRDKANMIENIEAGFITDRTTAFNFEMFEKYSKNGEIDTKSKMIILYKTAVCLQSRIDFDTETQVKTILIKIWIIFKP